MRLILRSIVIAIFLVWSGMSPHADEVPPLTDANLITALDASDSIMRHQEWLEVEGLAKAVTNGFVLDAIASGRHGRIGFAALTWSSAGRFEIIVPWTLIASTDDAARVANALRRFAIDRSSWKRDRDGSGESGGTPEHRTDISSTIDFAASLALTAPGISQRTVVNLFANGRDNVGDDPQSARDRALAAGIVINGLVMGGHRSLAAYFREHVQGGVGSFVIEVAQPTALVDAMIDKLLRDLIATRQSPPGAVPFT